MCTSARKSNIPGLPIRPGRFSVRAVLYLEAIKSAYDLDYVIDLIRQAIDFAELEPGSGGLIEARRLLNTELKPAIELEIELRLNKAQDAINNNHDLEVENENLNLEMEVYA